MSPATCPSCGHAVTPEQKFCAECGTRLTGVAPPPPEDERRLVTMLFADLVGSTALGESLDPDALYELTQRVHRRLDGIVQRYEGHIARHLGDGLLVLFGAPVAHENDAERAVLAALAMQDEITRLNAAGHDAPLGMRIGITSGEVVAGHFTGIYDVIGDAPNVAARLQGAAGVGGVLVGEETMRLARRRIRFGERQTLVLKGKRSPIVGYLALGLRARVGERWETDEDAGHHTPLVGRRHELETIQAAWTTAEAGEGSILTIVGEPGIGKSRLAAEGVERITTHGEVRVLRARCLSYGQSVSLWLIADLLRALCSIPEDADLERIREHVAVTVADVLAAGDDADRAIARDVIGEVLGLPPGDSLVAATGSSVRRSALVRIVGLLLSALSARGPLLLLLEDLHWIDTASSEILAALLPEVAGRAILVLATQRPGWTPLWSDWTRAEHVLLRPLAEEDASMLARAVLGERPISRELAGHLSERAEGNPFFLEELVRYLQEIGGLESTGGEVQLRPGVAATLPATLMEVLLARLDRMERQVKGVAQVGSVIGRSFAVRLLARVMEREEAALTDPLRSLQEADITYPQLDGELEHVFRHVLLRDAAYSMLVRKRQRQLHLAVGRAIATLYPADEYVEMIAFHLARTEEDAEAAAWLEKAGDRASAVYANQSAIAHLREAATRLERCGAGAADLARVDCKLAEVLTRTGKTEEAEALLRRAEQVYRRGHDLDSIGRVGARLAHIESSRGQWDAAWRRLDALIDLLRPAGASAALAQVQTARADGFFWLGQYREALEAATDAATVAQAAGDDRAWLQAEELRGRLLDNLDEAVPVLQEVARRAEQAGLLTIAYLALNDLACCVIAGGDPLAALPWVERAVETADRLGSPGPRSWARGNVAVALRYVGEWDQARTWLLQAVEIRQASDNPWPNWAAALDLGYLDVLTGRWDEARRSLEDQFDHLRTVLKHTGGVHHAARTLSQLDLLAGQPEAARDRLTPLVGVETESQASVLATLAWAYLACSQREEALATAHVAVELSRRPSWRVYLPESLGVQGMILAEHERWEEAERVFEEAIAVAHSMPYPYAEARALAEYGVMRCQQGEPQQGRERLEAALAIFRRLGALKDIERTQRALAEPDRSADLTQ
jgi:class 3 adenylate cyclase/tetratricopeptide (TPR) repeat protein